jgi:chromosome segregation ATPase
MSALAHILSVLEKNLEAVTELTRRVEFLERELDNAQETIREHEVTIGMHQDELSGFRIEIDELAAEVEIALEMTGDDL